MVTFHEKLKKIVADQSVNKSKASRDAGLPDSTISSYLAKPESLPRIDIALKLARVLDVPLEWLADDDAQFPIPGKDASAASLSDDELMLEVSRRWRIHAVRYFDAINKGETVDWSTVAEEILKLPFDAPLPAKLLADVRIAASLDGFHQDLLRYDPSIAALAFSGLPGDEIDPDEMVMERLENRWHSIRERGPGWQIVRDWHAISTHRRSPEEAKEDEHWRTRSVEKLNTFRQRIKSKSSKP